VRKGSQEKTNWRKKGLYDVHAAKLSDVPE